MATVKDPTAVLKNCVYPKPLDPYTLDISLDEHLKKRRGFAWLSVADLEGENSFMKCPKRVF